MTENPLEVKADYLTVTVIMVSGIALVEGNDKFIQEMKDNYRINENEFELAKGLYEENQKSVTKKA